MYVCSVISVCMYVRTYVRMYVFNVNDMYVMSSMYALLCVCMFDCLSVRKCIYVCMYVSMYVCM